LSSMRPLVRPAAAESSPAGELNSRPSSAEPY
jgi:hypothetical protein